jgi:tetratricopeptide (TPR) repeat protein
MTLPEFKALVREGHARGMPIVGHIPAGLPQQDVLGGPGLDLIAHSEEFKRYLSWSSSDADYASVVDRVAKHRIAVVANLVAVHEIEPQATALPRVMADADVAYLSSTAYQGWLDRNNDYSHRPQMTDFVASVRSLYSLMQKVVLKLNEANVLLLLGTDAPVDCFPGACVHKELGLLTGAGLSNYDALKSATFNAGVFVTTESRNRALDRFGVVAPGATADLILAPTNPLDDLSVLERSDGVMVSGVWRTSAELTEAREALLPGLKQRHALVDQYESLIAAKDFDRLFAFLDQTQVAGAALFSDRVISHDAATLAAAGDLDHAVGLLSRAKHLTGDSFRIYNELGRVLVMRGDRKGAEAQFRQSLVIAPHNGGAALGLQSIGLSDEDGE